MIVRTKKFQMNKSDYIKKGFFNLILEQWWVLLIYFAICSINFFIPSIWWIIGGSIALFLYLIFWLIQFFGVTQVEQSSYMFDKLSYEISSSQIMMKLNNKQGMPIKWDTIKIFKKLVAFEKINSASSEFSPSFYDDGIFYIIEQGGLQNILSANS